MEENLKNVECMECGSRVEPISSVTIDGITHTEYECENPKCVQRGRAFTVPAMRRKTARETWKRS